MVTVALLVRLEAKPGRKLKLKAFSTADWPSSKTNRIQLPGSQSAWASQPLNF